MRYFVIGLGFSLMGFYYAYFGIPFWYLCLALVLSYTIALTLGYFVFKHSNSREEYKE